MAHTTAWNSAHIIWPCSQPYRRGQIQNRKPKFTAPNAHLRKTGNCKADSDRYDPLECCTDLDFTIADSTFRGTSVVWYIFAITFIAFIKGLAALVFFLLIIHGHNLAQHLGMLCCWLLLFPCGYRRERRSTDEVMPFHWCQKKSGWPWQAFCWVLFGLHDACRYSTLQLLIPLTSHFRCICFK